MKKNTLILLALVALLTSCSTQLFYQVYDVKSPDVKQDGNVLVFENSDCKITYNLWSNGGNLNFLFTNKTSNNLYLVMPMSFFVLNGIANDYYSDSSHSLAITNMLSVASASQVSVSEFLTNGLAWYPTTLSRQVRAGVGTSKTETVTTREAEYVCIPPQSSKFIRGFNLSDYVYKDCKNEKENYPKRISSKISYDESNSPLVFRNRIAYSFDEKAEGVKYIEHKFYVESFQNYSEKAAFEKKSEVPCESKTEIKKKYFKVNAPNRFYNIYKLTY